VNRRALGVFLLAVGTAAWATASAPVDVGQSRITATFTQMNVPVDGRFTRFSGGVNYDAANVAGSSAELSIETASFDIGDEEYNAEVRKKEWFDSTAHPTAARCRSRAGPGPSRRPCA
jgi:polyisoprenoid-binding protein YceI